ncbi:hypothetical protein AB0I69_14785 [Streptomyces sp. NPDC050508]|uniref:hypothetical protein n=1 Tax=Streptomyces sp. NPDC050508 TaxID=3155405 RepID=UPI00342D14FF
MGAPEAALLPARSLLLLASLLTLALNVTEPLLVCMYGRAAFDAVDSLLLIGWAEVGPGLLQAISGIRAVTNAAPTLPRSSSGPTGGRLRSMPAAEAGTWNDGADDLLERARVEDARHWQAHRRPISAETLRKRLHVGAARSRSLVAVLRARGVLEVESGIYVVPR